MRFSEYVEDTPKSLYNEFLLSYADYTDKEKRYFIDRVKYTANNCELTKINIYRLHMLEQWLKIMLLPQNL